MLLSFYRKKSEIYRNNTWLSVNFLNNPQPHQCITWNSWSSWSPLCSLPHHLGSILQLIPRLFLWHGSNLDSGWNRHPNRTDQIARATWLFSWRKHIWSQHSYFVLNDPTKLTQCFTITVNSVKNSINRCSLVTENSGHALSGRHWTFLMHGDLVSYFYIACLLFSGV